MVVKRLFDILFSIILLVLLSPVFFIVVLYILILDRSNPFFVQKRVGKEGREFTLIKFRTMRNDKRNGLHITVGTRDPRITKAGFFLRKYKIDELPQLVNIFLGNMSFVGPRPEVKKYADFYTPEQREILKVKPGLTSYASLKFFDENRILEKSGHAEEVYIHDILPRKIEIDLEYIEKWKFRTDLKIIITTMITILKIPIKLKEEKKH
ncbi:MAG: sugar transferase [Chlorobi bacterium]|nr:sugar transferase [Chlorobiota bacterium]